MLVHGFVVNPVTTTSQGIQQHIFGRVAPRTISTLYATKEEEKKDEKEAGSSSKASREEKLKEAMEKGKTMKVKELKSELESRGVSTRTFFEKSEFVKAYAEAIADGVEKKESVNGSTSSSSRRASSPPPKEEEEEYDASYRDVTMQKVRRGDPIRMQGTIIDIRVPSK